MKILMPIFLLLSVAAESQQLTGTWEGSYSTGNFIPGRRLSFMHLELKQDGRKIEGVFYISRENAPQKMNVMYEISGELGRKKAFPFRLIKERILLDELPSGIADLFWQLDDIRYSKTDTAEFIYGKWIPNNISSPRADAAAGAFSVKRIDTTHVLLDKKLHLLKGR